MIADAPNVVWAIVFQFDSTIDLKPIKIISMPDERPRVAAEALDLRRASRRGLQEVFVSAGGPPKALRLDNEPEMICPPPQRFCEHTIGMVDIPPGRPWGNGYIELFNRLRNQCLNRNHWNTLSAAPSRSLCGPRSPNPPGWRCFLQIMSFSISSYAMAKFNVTV